MGIIFLIFKHKLQLTSWEKSFQFISDNAVSKPVTPAGSSSASSTESSQMVKCHQTNPSVVVMMPSTLSSQRLVQVNMSQEPSSSISSQPSLMRLEPVPTDNCSIQNNSSQVKKMPPTTSPEDITLSVKKSSISASIESESLPISALVSKVSLPSPPSVVVPVPVSDPSSSRDFPSITVRSPSSVSSCTHPHKCPPPLLSHTTPSSPPILFSNIPMSPSSLITKPSMISAEEILILRDQPTPT